MAARRIKWAKVQKLALCRQGANGFEAMYKSTGLDTDPSAFQIETLTKGFDEEKGLLTSVVYAPDRTDRQGQFAKADLIEKIAHEAMRDGGLELNLEHQGEDLAKSDAHVVESFIIGKGDTRFADVRDYRGQPVGDLSGAWAVVVKIESEALKKAYRSGKWKGISMEGQMLLEARKSEEPSVQEKDDTMTPEQIATLADTLSKSITDALTPIKTEIEALKKSATVEAEKEPTDAEKAKAERLRKTNRLKRDILNAETDDEEALAQKKMDLFEISEQMEKAMQGDDLDEVRDLKKTRAKLREDIETLEKSVEDAKSKKQLKDKKDKAPLGMKKSAQGEETGLELVGRLLKAGEPEQMDEQTAYEVGMGSVMAKFANEAAGVKVRKQA